MIKQFVTYNRRISKALRFKGISSKELFLVKIDELLLNSKKKILEVGGSERPLLDRNGSYEYWCLDIDESKNYDGLYDVVVIDEIQNLEAKGFDMIFSKFLLEHVQDVESMYVEMWKRLEEEGEMLHIYPLGGHPFSVLTKFVDELGLTSSFLKLIRPETIEKNGYKTFYNKGSGFEIHQILLNLPNCRYEVKFTYEAEDYFGFFLPFAVLINLFNRFCEVFNLTRFASNVVVHCKKTQTNQNVI